jgi:hypothetical protein
MLINSSNWKHPHIEIRMQTIYFQKLYSILVSWKRRKSRQLSILSRYQNSQTFVFTETSVSSPVPQAQRHPPFLSTVQSWVESKVPGESCIHRLVPGKNIYSQKISHYFLTAPLKNNLSKYLISIQKIVWNFLFPKNSKI